MHHKISVAAVCILALTACSGSKTSVHNLPMPDGAVASPFPKSGISEQVYHVANLRIDVPEDLVVSEANQLIPHADIVWRGEPFGDRHAQVRALFEESFAAMDHQIGEAVDVSIKVTRFHGLTEKARFLTGGNYAIYFEIALTDPASGKLVRAPQLVKIDEWVKGGNQPVLDEEEGVTERTRVIGFIKDELQKLLGQVEPVEKA